MARQLPYSKMLFPFISYRARLLLPLQKRPVPLLLVPVRGMKGKGYKNFGHQAAAPASFIRKLWMSVLMFGISFNVIDYEGIYLYAKKKVSSTMLSALPRASAEPLHPEKGPSNIKEISESGDEASDEEEEGKKKKKKVGFRDRKSADEASDEEEEGKKKKKKVRFRDRKVIEYENRIRHYSTPDKVFRYFSTCRVVNSSGEADVFMTPDDFLRSLTPGMKQPDGLGLDQFRTYDLKSMDKGIESCRKEFGLSDDSVFNKLGSYGLISFSDYIFLLTVLSTSRRHFEVAFRMFDLNGDGDVDREEFQRVADLARQQTSVGLRHRDHANTGSTFKGVNTALSHYFFGEKGDEKLTIDKFLDFQERLQTEILILEFNRRAGEDGRILEVDFADMLLVYAAYPDKFKLRTKKKIRKLFKESPEGISHQDYLNFFHFLSNINDVDTALTFYHVAGAAIDPATLKHVARTVAKVELSDHLVEVVYAIFDADEDGRLSNREFVAVMKNRLLRGLEKPKDTGFFKFLSSIAKCAKECRPALLDV